MANRRLIGFGPIATLTAVLLCATAVSHAKPKPADHLARGLRHYANKQFRQAATEFQRAYEQRPKRSILFAWAQATRLYGNCKAAIILYDRFIKEAPTPRDADAARKAMQLCPRQPPPAKIVKVQPPPPKIVKAPPARLETTSATAVRAHVRVDVDISRGGAVAAPGASVSLLGRLELFGNALLGGNLGGEMGMRLTVMDGRLQPFVSGALPLFFANGTRLGARGGVGVRLNVSGRVSATMQVGVSHAFSAPQMIDRTILLGSTAVELSL